MVNMETGEVLRYESGSEGNFVAFERTTPPPCLLGLACPKESPDHEHLHALNRRNLRMYHTWRTARATRDFFCPDGLRATAYRAIDDLDRQHQRHLLAQDICRARKGW